MGEKNPTAAETVAENIKEADEKRALELKEADKGRADALEEAAQLKSGEEKQHQEKQREDSERKRQEDRADAAVKTSAERRMDTLKFILLPIVLALISGAVVAVPGSITAWRQGRELEEIKQTGLANQETTLATHRWVNSNMRFQLEKKYEYAQKVSELEPNAMNIEAARSAKQELEDHEKQQAKLDQSTKDRNSNTVEPTKSTTMGGD